MPSSQGTFLHFLRMSQCATVAISLADGSSRQFAARPGTYYVGRDAGCHFVIDSESVSRRHARLKIGLDRVTVTDLDSTGGVIVNGLALGRERAAHYPVRIELG